VLARLFAIVFSSGFLFAQTPDQVLIVVNQSSPVSRQIAEYYRQQRHIPPANVCALKVTADERIDRAVFNTQVVKPITDCLKTRHLEEKILYIVTTLGVPLAVKGVEAKDGDYASVDSELTLLYSDMKKGPHPLKGPLANPFYQQRDIPFSHPRYPIYLVTRLAGYDFQDVKAMIDKALVAKNRGKFVIDLRSDDDEPGNDWLRTAAILLPKDRVYLEESKAVVTNQKDVIGFASWGSNDSNRTQRTVGFQWLPGAIMTEFVSTNARTFQRPPATWTIGPWSDHSRWFNGGPQTLTADYIHEGVTGASGHTDEPYLGMCPRPDYLLPAYYSGRNLAESYYLAIPALSWQNVVIGDPLCSLGKP